LHRFPLNDTTRKHCDELAKLCLDILKTDNEDNAVICLKILNELFRMFKVEMTKYVQPFYDLVYQIFQNFKQSVVDSFDKADSNADTVNKLHILSFAKLTYFNIECKFKC
jgi:transformation/transcription domain-associated protein